MNESESELLMRYHDGECSPAELASVEQLLRDDPEAVDALGELSRQRDGFAKLPPVISTADTETDWNEIRAKILTEDEVEEPAKKINWLAWAPSWTWGAAAAVFALASVVFLLPKSEMPPPAVDYNIVDAVETDITGATPIVYVDKESGWSVVWVDEQSAS